MCGTIAGFFLGGEEGKYLRIVQLRGNTMSSIKFRQRMYAVVSLLLLIDSVLVSLIITWVPCTSLLPARFELTAC